MISEQVLHEELRRYQREYDDLTKEIRERKKVLDEAEYERRQKADSVHFLKELCRIWYGKIPDDIV